MVKSIGLSSSVNIIYICLILGIWQLACGSYSGRITTRNDRTNVLTKSNGIDVLVMTLKDLYLALANRSSPDIFLESTVIGIIIFLTVVGNTFVCCAVWRNNRLRTISNMFVVALAISDSLMGVLCMPFVFGTLIKGRWPFGDAFCRVHGFTGFTLALISIHTMSLIAINRYYCIVKSGKYQSIFRSHRTRIFILMVWLFAFVGSVPPFLLKGGGYTFHPGKAMCLYTFESNPVYTVFIEAGYIGCPLLLITFCYSSVFKEVYRTNKVFAPNQVAVDQLRVNVQETKITKTLAIVFLGFSICWLPASVIDTLGAFYGEPRFKREVYLAYTYMAYLSSLINPIIYGITSRGFRREYKAMLRGITCYRIWHQNVQQSTTFQESNMEAWQNNRPYAQG